MEKKDDNFQDELLKPKMGFLLASGAAAVTAMVVYIFEDDITAGAAGGAGDSGITFAFLLIVLVLLAMFFMLCYRVPRIGARLMGYDKLTGEKKNTNSDVQFTAGFKSETAVDTKRLNTKRKQARHSRRKLAAITREMQQENSEKPDLESKKAEFDSKNDALDFKKADSEPENT